MRNLALSLVLCASGAVSAFAATNAPVDLRHAPSLNATTSAKDALDSTTAFEKMCHGTYCCVWVGKGSPVCG